MAEIESGDGAPPPSRLDIVKALPRSVSQLTEYTECPHRFYLARVERVWQEPAAWFPQGTAVHRAAELWELTRRTMTLDEAQAVFAVAYEAEVASYTAVTPRWDHWASSGPYACPADVERRYTVGMGQVEKYLDYYTTGKGAEDKPITIDGRPAVELGFVTTIGDVKVRGYIDGVMETPKRGIVVRDNKTGSTPGKPIQPKVYGVALRQEYDINPDHGDFWMAKTGSATRSPVKLSPSDGDELAEQFGAMDAAVKAEQFDPKPGEQCRRCSVRDACLFAAR